MFYFLFAAFVIAVSISRGETNLFVYLKLKSKQKMLTDRIEELTEVEKRLRKEIFKIENFPEYARKILRDRYHQLDEGEIIVYRENN